MSLPRDHARKSWQQRQRRRLILITTALLAGSLITLAGLWWFAQHTGHKRTLDEARLALECGRPRLALSRLAPLLQQTPADPVARQIGIHAHLALAQLEAAQAQLAALLREHPPTAQVQHLRVAVARRALTAHRQGAAPDPKATRSLEAEIAAAADWFNTAGDNPAEAAYLTGLIAHHRNNHATAGAAFAQAIDHDPDHPRAWPRLLNAQLAQGQLTSLWKSLRQLADRPKIPAALADRAIALALGIPDEIAAQAVRVTVSQRLLQAIPFAEADTQSAQLAKARLLLAQTQPHQAQAVLDPLRRNHPNNPEAALLAALCHLALEQPDAAAQLVQQAREQHPNHPTAATLQALIEQQAADAPAAATAALAGVQAAPPPHRVQTQALLTAGDHAAAAAAARAWAAECPDALFPFLAWADSLLAENQAAAADAALAKIHPTLETDPQVQARRAACRLIQGRPGAALTLADAALTQQPTLSAARVIRARALLGLWRFAAARAELDTILTTNPQDPAALNTLQQLNALEQNDFAAWPDYHPQPNAPKTPPPTIAPSQLDRLAASSAPYDRVRCVTALRQIKEHHGPATALRHVERFRTADPTDRQWVYWQVQLLLTLDRATDAARTLDEEQQRHPTDTLLAKQRVAVCVAQANFPAALQAIDALADHPDIAPTDRAIQRARLFQLCQLPTPAAAALDAVPDLAPVHPATTLALAQLERWLDRPHRARQRLNAIPASAPDFITAQLLLAELDLEADRDHPARQRLSQLLRTAQHRAPTIRALTQRNAADPATRRLLAHSDTLIELNALTPATRRQWLPTRLVLAAEAANWPRVAQTLTDLATAHANHPTATTARALALAAYHHLGHDHHVQTLWQNHPELHHSPAAACLALIANDYPPATSSAATAPPFLAYVQHALTGNQSAAATAWNQLATAEALRAAGPAAFTAPGPQTTPPDRTRDLAAAAVAQHFNLPTLSAALAARQLDRHPADSLAAGLWLQAQLNQARPVAPAQLPPTTLDRAPALAHWLTAHAAAQQEDWFRAVEELEATVALAGRAPALDLRRAQWLAAAGAPEAAITTLQRLLDQSPAPPSAAINALGCLTAEHQPTRAAELLPRVTAALEQQPNHGPLLDTRGWLELTQDRPAAALPFLQRSLAAGPVPPEVHARLATAYAALGQHTWSRHHAAASQRHEPPN